MGQTVPAWARITALAMWIVGMGASLARAVVPWKVRLRFPLPDIDPRPTPSAASRDDVLAQLVEPTPRWSAQTANPPGAQPAARRPEDVRPRPAVPVPTREGTTRVARRWFPPAAIGSRPAGLTIAQWVTPRRHGSRSPHS